MATLIDGAGALLLEDWTRMDRLLPHPRTPVGYWRDGRPIFPILGADPTDPSNQQRPPAPSTDPAVPPAQVPDQGALNRLLAREKQQGERAAVRKLVEQLGFTKTDDLTSFVQQQREAQVAQLSEIERREQVAAEATTAAQRREAQAVVPERAAVRRSALVALGATGDDLKDAERLLAVEDDADEDTIAEAATALKARRPELFAATTTPVPPAAPGGSPAGGPPPRGATMPKPGQHGADMARQRGFVTGS
ncbi:MULTISPECIES: hypothetical protein [unclassified Streptomyces]|uniref:hypothetical protein n=1 Tax=unclassified Streptomyces TaxID=2593676 RepID=UPI002E81B90C|nr:hypothetical protein [Streptomyces sp. NBC_00589]WTI33571.1 hypothetical protein OIC96_00305 [Streptomyces sp. NBC_00775]WUB32757.1 hypothetical protein OHA51_49430 [Streptomyces sp. NBC_00589]